MNSFTVISLSDLDTVSGGDDTNAKLNRLGLQWGMATGMQGAHSLSNAEMFLKGAERLATMTGTYDWRERP